MPARCAIDAILMKLPWTIFSEAAARRAVWEKTVRGSLRMFVLDGRSAKTATGLPSAHDLCGLNRFTAISLAPVSK